MASAIIGIREELSSVAFEKRFTSEQMKPYSRFETNIGRLSTSVADIRQAPPGFYEYPPYDGVAVYLALSRNVGRIDIGEGAFDMHAQCQDFIVGVPGSGGRMDSFHGWHGAQVVISPEVLEISSREAKDAVSDFGLLHRSFHRNRRVSEIISKIVDAALSGTGRDANRVDELVVMLADALLGVARAEERRAREATALGPAVVERVVQFMEANLAEPLSNERLADIAGMPMARFLKAFRNAVGDTPYQHLTRRRLEAARLQLMEDKSTIVEIALTCGFSSQQHLTGLFSERFGIAPAAFRNQTLQNKITERKKPAHF